MSRSDQQCHPAPDGAGVPGGASQGQSPARGAPDAVPRSGAALDRLWKAKRDAGYSSNSVRIMRTVLRRALGQAVREGIVGRNVAALSAAPRVRAREGRTLTVAQARQLLDAAAGQIPRLIPDRGSRSVRGSATKPFRPSFRWQQRRARGTRSPISPACGLILGSAIPASSSRPRCALARLAVQSPAA